MLKGMFKKTTYINITSEVKKEMDRAGTPQETVEIPEGLWTKCPKCGQSVYTKDLEDNFLVCAKCGHNLRMGARTRMEMIVDPGTFVLWDNALETGNPLDFPGYPEKIQKAQESTGLKEAVISGKGNIMGQETAIAVMDASFFMGSMGHVVGEKITRLIERATSQQLPVVIYCCSGGARMQEGMFSLMQMAKTSAAIKRHSDAGLFYLTVLTDPTTGGVTASFAMLGDIILAEPGALVGFAGPRVIEQTIGQKLPKGFQRAEFLLEHGLIDAIVERKDQKEVIGKLLSWHSKKEQSPLGGGME
ncbi:acetyl-CoA carboxylase carboxyl transferase beta subunit [Catenibacillus scindens]|uniref:Acetyl-coenzyme A carboxylase carboxyl transferase subunit beta n=1 Tax=Catenibacillus scindens TaxID=673271 RepID=A0A7W8H9J3_9FIRM|nr:acetyl-CoA carboxylase carboxyl transferase beta subunit [Catenibacillus scindens]